MVHVPVMGLWRTLHKPKGLQNLKNAISINKILVEMIHTVFFHHQLPQMSMSEKEFSVMLITLSNSQSQNS